MVVRSNRVGGEWNDALSELFNFKFLLADRDGEVRVPPPAFNFLPFYLDQDAGWTEIWKSFENLRQFPKFDEKLAEFHLGIRPNEYYDAQSKVDKLKKEVDVIKSEIRILNKTKKASNNSEQYALALPAIDVAQFEREVDELMLQLKDLLLGQNKIRNESIILQGELVGVQHRIELTQSAIRGNDKIKDKILESLREDTLKCPVCNTSHSDEFPMVYSLALDKNGLTALLNDLNIQNIQIDERIKVKLESLRNLRDIQSKMEKILDVKKGELKLRDYVQLEGERLFSSFIETEINARNKNITECELSIYSEEKVKKKYDNKARVKQIKSEFSLLNTKIAFSLSLPLVEKPPKGIVHKLNGQGSARAREILSHFSAFITIKCRYSNSALFPMVVDSPNQQGQDSINLPQMIKCLDDNRPSGIQLILALGEECPSIVSQDVTMYKLNKKFTVLESDLYTVALEEVGQYLNKIFGA